MKHPTFNKARAGLAVLVLLEVLLLAAQLALFRFRTDPMTLTPARGSAPTPPTPGSPRRA